MQFSPKMDESENGLKSTNYSYHLASDSMHNVTVDLLYFLIILLWKMEITTF